MVEGQHWYVCLLSSAYWLSILCTQDYYFYLFSNRLAAEGMYINMNAYQKLYNLSSDYSMADFVFLDKGNWFSITAALLSHKDTFTSADSPGLWSGST